MQALYRLSNPAVRYFMILLGAGRLEAYSLEIDLIEKLKRIYYFAKRMAKDVIPDVCPLELTSGQRG